VLVVDDSELTQALVRRALEARGYSIITVRGSDEALELLAEQEVDAVVVDVIMPKIDGIQLIQLARSRPVIGPDVPVVFYSAHIDQGHMRRRLAGMQPATVVAKDGHVHDLVEAVTNLIEGHAAARASSPPAAVIRHFGRGLVAIGREQNDADDTVYELRRGAEVLLQAPTMDQLMHDARSAGIA
jgi:CheY-like chemotaxis protein